MISGPWIASSGLATGAPRGRPCPWQDTQTILSQFGAYRRRAVVAYRTSVRGGIAHGHQPGLQGGGLLRSHRGWGPSRLSVGAERPSKETKKSSGAVPSWKTITARSPPPPPNALVLRSTRSSPGFAGKWPPLHSPRRGPDLGPLPHPGRDPLSLDRSPWPPLGPIRGLHPSAILKGTWRTALAVEEWGGRYEDLDPPDRRGEPPEPVTRPCPILVSPSGSAAQRPYDSKDPAPLTPSTPRPTARPAQTVRPPRTVLSPQFGV